MGKVEIIHPMTFDEFLLAKEKGQMATLLHTLDWKSVTLLRTGNTIN